MKRWDGVSGRQGGVPEKAVASHRIYVESFAAIYLCREDESLLACMHRLDQHSILVGCRGGGCGVCKIEVLSGDYRVARMSRNHVSAEDETGGRVLACRVFPRGDLAVRILGRVEKRSASPKQ